MERVDADLVPFAQNNPSGYRFAFGTDTATDDINVNYNDNIKKGWGTTPNEFPEVEDFNAFAYTSGYLTAYLYQMGIAEWNDKQKYKQHSRVIGSDGKIYKAKTGTDLSPNVDNNPTTDITNTNWDVDNQIMNSDITVDVGAGQTYTTINQALEYLSGFYPMYKKSGITATINLKAGFVMAEQVLISGIDLGWITIVGEDAETIITHTALTTDFNGTNYPAFGVDKGGTSPIIGQLFRFNVEKVGGNKHGLMAFGARSSANVLSGKGFIGAGTNGIYAVGNSTINAYGANASNAENNGIFANSSSIINADSANCSNAGNIGILAGGASVINAYVADCSNAGVYGIFSDGASLINATNAIIQNQTTGIARVGVALGSTVTVTGASTTGGTVIGTSQTLNALTAQGIIYG